MPAMPRSTAAPGSVLDDAPADNLEADPGWVHIVCECSPDEALCGADVSGRGYTDADVSCPLCDWVDTSVMFCPRCGGVL